MALPVAALGRLAVADGKLAIGACVRHVAFHKPPVEGPLAPVLGAPGAPIAAVSMNVTPAGSVNLLLSAVHGWQL